MKRHEAAPLIVAQFSQWTKGQDIRSLGQQFGCSVDHLGP